MCLPGVVRNTVVFTFKVRVSYRSYVSGHAARTQLVPRVVSMSFLWRLEGDGDQDTTVASRT